MEHVNSTRPPVAPVNLGSIGDWRQISRRISGQVAVNMHAIYPRHVVVDRFNILDRNLTLHVRPIAVNW